MIHSANGTNHDVGANDCAYFFDAYLNVPSKLQHSLRCAYYCSPVIGCNNGKLENIYMSATILADDSAFVGFIGGICGLQNRGSASKCVADVTFNERLKERTTADNIKMRTLDYNLGDVTDSKFSYTENNKNDGTFELYFRTAGKQNKYRGSMAIYDPSDLDTPVAVVNATAYFPKYDDRDNCARKPLTKSNLTLEPCYYTQYDGDEGEPVTIQANNKKYQLFRCAIPEVQMNFSDHDNGNYHIDIDSSNVLPLSNGVPNALSTTKTTTASTQTTVYAKSDIMTLEDGTSALIDGATPLNIVNTSTGSFTASWPKEPHTEIIDDPDAPGLTAKVSYDYAAQYTKVSATTNSITRKDNLSDNAIVTISNFKVGVTYGKVFSECTNDDLYIYNDGALDSVTFPGVSNTTTTNRIIKRLYDTYPLGISFDQINTTKFSIDTTAYRIFKVTGAYTGTKKVDTTDVVLGNGNTVQVASNYNQSTHAEVQAAINSTYDNYINDSLSAHIYGTTSKWGTDHAGITTSAITESAEHTDSKKHVDNATLKLRGIKPINTNDNVATSSHFDSLASYVITTTAVDEVDSKGEKQTITVKPLSLAEAAAKAAVIYTSSADASRSLFQDNYFAVKEVLKDEMTATVGIVTTFSSVKYIEKSIYNVGGYAGMLSISDGFAMTNCTAAYSVSANPDSKDSERKVGPNDSTPDIVMFDRYGGLAAKTEIQTHNISNTVELDASYHWPESNAVYAHGFSATNCVFYNNYVVNDDSEISKAIIAEINYLRLPIPSIYQFENGMDRDSKGKNYKVGIWTSDVPYHQHPVTINLWNNSVGSAAWPYSTSESNPHYKATSPDNANIQFASEHTRVYKLFNFTNCSAGQTSISDIKLLTSAYIPALNAINSFSKVWAHHGDRDDGGATKNWNRSNCYFRANTKVMATHDYMAGDTILLTAEDGNNPHTVAMARPTKHFLQMSFDAENTVNRQGTIPTAVAFTGENFKVVYNKSIPASADIVAISPMNYVDTYFTYTYDVSARSEGPYIDIDEPVKKLKFTKNITITDMESDLIALQTFMNNLFSILAEGYDTKDDTTIKRSTISSIKLTNETREHSFDSDTVIDLKTIADTVKTQDCSMTVTWTEYTYKTNQPAKTEDQLTIETAQQLKLTAAVQLSQYLFKSIMLDQKNSTRIDIRLIHPESELIRHGYVFEDELNTREESTYLASEYFGNTIHIGTKPRPSYIRSQIANAESQTFTYSGASFTDLAGFLIVDTNTPNRNLVAFVDAGDGEVELNNSCWSMKFDQATTDANTNYPYNTSALLINITTEEE